MKNAILCCAGCGTEYGADAWSGLPWVCTLSRADVHRYVVDWPKARVVEVRLCQACGRSMARTASSRDGDPLAAGAADALLRARARSQSTQ